MAMLSDEIQKSLVGGFHILWPIFLRLGLKILPM